MKKLLLWLLTGLSLAGLACNLPSQTAVNPTQSSPVAENQQGVTDCTVPEGWHVYTVAEGEDLLRIAVKTGSSVDELVTANCLGETMTVTAGQIIYVPNPPFPEGETATGTAAYYLIIPGDAGASGPAVGCGDSAIAAQSDQPTYGILTEDMRASLEALFAIKTETVGQSGLVNSLHHTDLTVQHISISNDTAVVNLLGTLSLLGVCADAQMSAQILMTIFQYTGFDQAFITLNGENLKQLFDASGLVQPGDFYQR